MVPSAAISNVMAGAPALDALAELGNLSNSFLPGLAAHALWITPGVRVLGAGEFTVSDAEDLASSRHLNIGHLTNYREPAALGQRLGHLKRGTKNGQMDGSERALFFRIQRTTVTGTR